MAVDDSALLHAGDYDPAYARAYYLRTRKLKGRKKASGLPKPKSYYDRNQNTVAKDAPAAFRRAAEGNEGKYNQDDPPTPAERRAQLTAQRDALEARLDRLREVLRAKVAAAQKRSGVESKANKTPESKKTETEKSKKEDSKLTEQEKREKAEKAREEYKKENQSPSLSKEVEQLQREIRAIQLKIKKAVEDARANSSPPSNQTTQSR